LDSFKFANQVSDDGMSDAVCDPFDLGLLWGAIEMGENGSIAAAVSSADDLVAMFLKLPRHTLVEHENTRRHTQS
jgi:hypothetical protein